MIPVEQAQALCLEGLSPLPAEVVALDQARGRILAAPATAARAQPPFASSAMDGYALRAGDTAPGAELRIIGEAAAGHAWTGRIGPGETLRIFTGAPLPEGADTIVIQEDVTRLDPGLIRLSSAAAPGANIRAKGTDFPAGHRLDPPRRLGPAELALLAAMNIAEVQVTRRPVVALVATGDELVLPGADPRPDQIIASNTYALAAMIEEAGAIPRPCPIARDTAPALRASLSAAEGADIVVTIGGASVGDHDLVADILRAEGVALGFHKVALRPGKPLMAGRRGAVAYLGLPGNPVSAIVCGQLFLLPMIRRLLGLEDVLPPVLSAALQEDLPANGPRAHYMRARFEEATEGRRVTPFDRQDSSLLTVLAEANCLLLRPPSDGPVAAGQPVPILPFAGNG